MSRLIIVAGAGGAGKSFFLRMWARHDRNAYPIKKYVSDSRSPREIEIRTGESDLVFSRRYDPETAAGMIWYRDNYPGIVPSQNLTYHDRSYDFSSCEEMAVYDYHGTYYEVDIERINIALKNGKNPIVIVRKCDTIKKLLKVYRDALIIYVQSILSGKDLVEKLVALGESRADAERRESRNVDDLNDYIASIHQLPSNIRVVVNNYDEDATGAVFTQIRDIYNEEIRKYKFKQNSIFVIQSYKNELKTMGTLKMIKAASQAVFGSSENVYQANMRQDGSYLISTHVLEMLDACDYIVCDITNDRCSDCKDIINTQLGSIEKKRVQGTSSNVWIELGYALSRLRTRGIPLEKRLIIISQSNGSETIPPIDIGGSSINIIYYYDQASLLDAVQANLKNML